MDTTIRIDTWTGGYMVLQLDQFFPCSQVKLYALHKHILRGCKHETEVYDQILSYLKSLQEAMDREYAQYEIPDYETSRSKKWKTLCGNISLLEKYRKKARL